MNIDQTIKDLNHLAQESLKVYPNVDGLETVGHILMIRTVRSSFFLPVIEKIKKAYPNIKISVIGDETDAEWIKRNGFDENSLFIHHGTINREVFDLHANQLKDIDAICYVGPSVYRQTYLNVLDACSYYAKKIRVPVFAYVRSEELIYKIIDSEKLLVALKITGAMIEYANESCKKEMYIS